MQIRLIIIIIIIIFIIITTTTTAAVAAAITSLLYSTHPTSIALCDPKVSWIYKVASMVTVDLQLTHK